MSSELFIQKRREQLNTIKSIINDQKVLNNNQLLRKYHTFSEKYPKTWINILDSTFNINQLERNVLLYERYYKNSKGTHENKRFQADVGFGEHLAKKYLYPTTGNPSNEQKNKSLALARKKAGLDDASK